MFLHIYTFRLKTLFRDRITLFWTLFFPVMLATFFFAGLSGIRSADDFQAIQIAIVDNEAWRADEGLQDMFTNMSEGENPMFEVTMLDESAARERLLENTIAGYIMAGSPPELYVTGSGYGPSVTSMALNQYSQITSTVTTLISRDPASAEAILSDLGEQQNWLESQSITENEIDPLLTYFYALIAMSCFYGSLLGMREIQEIQANHSAVAARVNVSATKKMKMFLSSSLASLTLHFTQLILLLLFIQFVLGIDFGRQAGFIALTTFLGSLCGLAYGSFISSIIRVSEGVKVAILMTSTMLMSFLSGMMFDQMKYIIRQRAPILAYINPVSLLADALFSLNYFDSYQRYAVNMILLAALTLLFVIMTYLSIRRPRYASI